MSVRRRARPGRAAGERAAGTAGSRSGAAAPARKPSTAPRYLTGFGERASPPLLIQRQEETALPAVPRLELTPPSLLQPRDPYARFRPDFGNRLRLDPELELRMLSLSRTLLSPSHVLSGVRTVAPVLTVPASPGAGGSPAPGAPAPAGATTPDPTTPAPTTPPPGTTPAPGGTGPGEEGPRPGEAGDVLGAVLATPQVSLLLEDVQSRFTTDFSRYWRGASTGERVGFVGGSVVVGGAMLAPLLGFEEPREFLLPLLNDVVLPVPGLDGYGLEFRFGERDVMVGVHVDVGRLLPSFMGFGEASFEPIGGQPGSDPTAMPPISRQADGDAGAADRGGIAAGIRAHAGAGAALDDELREELEPRLGADLSPVRVHTGAGADALAGSVRAQAFTTGKDIFFRAGRYDPASAPGRRLLAHELVHVAQQTGPAAPPAHGVEISEPGDPHEREAEAVTDDLIDGADGAAPVRATAAAPPTGAVQRQPEPAAKSKGGARPVSSAEAKRAAPPQWTDYFDEVVPAVLEAAESNEKIGLDRALWLIIQAYGEQSPRTGAPSTHRNRLFNEQAAVEMKDRKIKRVLPGQESEGVYLYNLPQNESPTRDKQDIKTSPTFGYDTPERAAHHHVHQLQARWGGAWGALTAEKGSFEGFAHALKRSGYAKAETYDTDLIALQHQVRSQVAAWVRHRLPEMRERIPRMEEYLEFLRQHHAMAVQRAAEEPDPVGFLKAEVANYAGMVEGMVLQLTDVRARHARLERFAGVLGVKVE